MTAQQSGHRDFPGQHGLLSLVTVRTGGPR